MIDGDRARRHIAKLKARGLSNRQIGELAGISPYAVNLIVNGTTKQVRESTARALSAVPLRPAAGMQIDGLGTTRRLRALTCMGWSQTEIARRLGVAQNNACFWYRDGVRVTVATQKAVAGLYDQISGTDGGNTRARNTALRNGWVPPLGWDDIDTDPEPTDWKRSKTDRLHVEDITELRSQGYEDWQIADRLGTSVDYLRKVERREAA